MYILAVCVYIYIYTCVIYLEVGPSPSSRPEAGTRRNISIHPAVSRLDLLKASNVWVAVKELKSSQHTMDI